MTNRVHWAKFMDAERAEYVLFLSSEKNSVLDGIFQSRQCNRRVHQAWQDTCDSSLIREGTALLCCHV